MWPQKQVRKPSRSKHPPYTKLGLMTKRTTMGQISWNCTFLSFNWRRYVMFYSCIRMIFSSLTGTRQIAGNGELLRDTHPGLLRKMSPDAVNALFPYAARYPSSSGWNLNQLQQIWPCTLDFTAEMLDKEEKHLVYDDFELHGEWNGAIVRCLYESRPNAVSNAISILYYWSKWAKDSLSHPVQSQELASVASVPYLSDIGLRRRVNIRRIRSE